MFLGLSTGRAGSVYTARVMARAGLAVSHETYFNEDNTPGGPTEWPDRIIGEWSAQAVPYLHRFPDVWRLHQVRHPLKVIGSYLGFGLLDHPQMLAAPSRLLFDHAHLWEHTTPIARASRLYVEWNRLIERDRRYVWWRLEDLTPLVLVEVFDWIGVAVSPDRLVEAFAVTATDTNTRRNAVTISWSDVPVGLRGDVKATAERYGYETST